MISRFTGRIALAGVAASFVFAGAPAVAQRAPIYVQVPENFRAERVSYWDLNLATRAGEQALYRRVDQAIDRVCLRDQGRWYGLSEPDFNHCIWGAWDRARPQMAGAVYRARQAAYYAAYYRGY
jgi:UrcA family protein